MLHAHRSFGPIFNFWYRWCFSLQYPVLSMKIITWSSLESLQCLPSVFAVWCCFVHFFLYMAFSLCYFCSYVVLLSVCCILPSSWVCLFASYFPLMLRWAGIHYMTGLLNVALACDRLSRSLIFRCFSAFITDCESVKVTASLCGLCVLLYSLLQFLFAVLL